MVDPDSCVIAGGLFAGLYSASSRQLGTSALQIPIGYTQDGNILTRLEQATSPSSPFSTSAANHRVPNSQYRVG
ncbi:hypothetical protein [Nocardia sp. NPDC051981]|uniref:hypothetical protein n=1 Tax=Nocardia sp. NPDC051981 TaxID=3155417 RepID=UPI003443E1F9